MVKITNIYGDIKTGKQEQAVYQGKYGQQIRRTLQPKRAIPSTAQLERRQLFDAALAWRKQLSLDNRRFLGGYPIANGILDSYGIPLDWSRFALKLYLQKVKFVIVDQTLHYQAGETVLYENYQATGTSVAQIYGVNWFCQTFKSATPHNIVKVAIYGYRTGNPGTMTASIRATDGTGKPTGADLCSGTTDANTMVLTPNDEWREISLGAGTNLLANVTYALILRCPSGNSVNRVNWRYSAANPYTNGQYGVSSNSGVSWSMVSSSDFKFKEWGLTPPVSYYTYLIHVRHPALLTAIHKRGEQIIKQYGALSSLDEQYLTSQVGFDALKGDLILATNIAGLQYQYEV